jgi:glycosyltransferase involved in cell wall biosynthesis
VKRHLFILVPSPQPTGPIKGAVALANSLVDLREITLVYIKPGPGVDAPLDKRVKVVSLSLEKSFRGKLVAYKKLLQNAGGRERVASLSICFIPDMVNLFCRRHAVTSSSVRANLLHNYHKTYGLPGIPLAITHIATMRGFDHVVAMTDAMAKQVHFYASRNPDVIGNFVDEVQLEPYRCMVPNKDGAMRFVFLGSLTPRKRPMVLLKAINELRRDGIDVHLDIIGDGPMRKQLEDEITKLCLSEAVVLHGHLPVPYHLVAQADALVLPSSSEGISRASLEALHLGVPCVLRDIDGNNELIHLGENGALFRKDEELSLIMYELAVWSRSRIGSIESLLPSTFRQSVAAHQYLALMESNT